MQEELLEVECFDELEQTLEIVAFGNSAAGILPGAAEYNFDDEAERTPDPVFVFAAAAQSALIGASGFAPWRVTAQPTLLRSGPNQIAWKLELAGMPTSGLRILLNMVRSQRFQGVRMMATSTSKRGVRPYDAKALLDVEYPKPFGPLPFVVDAEEPFRVSKNRLFQIAFKNAPDDNLTEKTYAALDLWARLILMGGYAGKEQHPSKSGAVPDIAFLLDETTVQQAFTEIFQADEGAFCAAINLAHSLSRNGSDIEKVVIR